MMHKQNALSRHIHNCRFSFRMRRIMSRISGVSLLYDLWAFHRELFSLKRLRKEILTPSEPLILGAPGCGKTRWSYRSFIPPDSP